MLPSAALRIMPAALALMLLATALLAGCARSARGSSGVEIGLRLATERQIGPATVEVTVRASDGTPIDDAEVVVRGDMGHAGMKPVLARSRSAGGGRYLAEDFHFTMAGDWVLTAEVALPGGERAERTLKVSGVTAR